VKLMFFVEGDDDQRFIERTIVPAIATKYDVIKYFRYASSVPKETCKVLRTLESTGWDYLFLADRDQSACKTHRREKICEKMQVVTAKKIIVVDQEIESWYVSGLDAASARGVGLDLPRSSELFSKEHLVRLVGKRFPTATDLKLFLLDSFSLEVGRKSNASFAYLCKRLGI